LVPEGLGKVTVQVALIDQAVSARIVVSNPEVREILQHHMVDLKSALSQAGLQIDQLQVQVQGGGASLLAQYYQYQQEGGAYRSSAGLPLETLESPETVENKGISAVPTGPVSLVNLLV
jgi:flagellar hook-length control protein FliK